MEQYIVQSRITKIPNSEEKKIQKNKSKSQTDQTNGYELLYTRLDFLIWI